MTENEARSLLSLIEVARKPGAARMRRIGNGEHVCIVKRLDFWCWSFDDWLRYREMEEQRHRQKVEATT